MDGRERTHMFVECTLMLLLVISFIIGSMAIKQAQNESASLKQQVMVLEANLKFCVQGQISAHKEASGWLAVSDNLVKLDELHRQGK